MQTFIIHTHNFIIPLQFTYISLSYFFKVVKTKSAHTGSTKVVTEHPKISRSTVVTGELQPETSIVRSLIRHCMRVLQARIYIAIWYATTLDDKTHVPYDCIITYYTPYDGFTANDASFYKNKIVQLHYTLQWIFSINRLCYY